MKILRMLLEMMSVVLFILAIALAGMDDFPHATYSMAFATFLLVVSSSRFYK